MNLKRVVMGVSLGLCACAAGAMPYPGGWGWAPPPQQAQPADPASIVREGLGKLDNFLAAAQRPDDAAIRAFLITEIAPYFDLEYMSRWAAGPLYRRLDPAQRSALAEGLGQLFFRNMATHLAGYSGGQIRYLPSHRGGGNEVTVRVQVYGPQRIPVNLDFRMYRAAQGWKVFDIQANGRSAALHYRQLLAGLARHGGLQGMLRQLTAM